MPNPEHELVEVIWRDAQNSAGWHSMSEFDGLDCPVCHCSGYLISQDDRQVVVAMTVSEDQCCGVMQIPAPWVIEVVPLRRGKANGRSSSRP